MASSWRFLMVRH